MRRMVMLAISNSPAMNILMVAVLVVGTISIMSLRREVFPEFELEIVLVTVPYPGASPSEVEEGICLKVEEAVQTIDGIKKLTSVAQEGAGSVVLELRSDVKDVQKIVSEVRAEVDRIPSFPELAEDPDIRQITIRDPAINVAIMMPPGRELDGLELREVAEMVRDELLSLNAVSQVNIEGARDYQIDIEIAEQTLQKYGLSLQQVAAIVRRENLEVPGGSILGDHQEILLRGENKGLVGQEIAALPLVSEPGGAVLTVGDLGTVKDEFTDVASVSEINGMPALVLDVSRTRSEDMLAMTQQVRDYVDTRVLPGGYTMRAYADRSVDVDGRLRLLEKNGAMGLLLVFIVLAVFLEIRLAFWVAVGIPVALLGAGGVLALGGQSLNMLSMFSFLLALGIVVDDAIVVGENVYAQRQLGKSSLQAAIDGTVEVMPSVFASVATTIIAFCPMFFVTGVMGKFFAVIPFAVIAMLGLSLFECAFILPCHLAHNDNLIFRVIRFFFYPLGFVVRIFAHLNRMSGRYLKIVIDKFYAPALRKALQFRYTVLAGALVMLMIAVSLPVVGYPEFVVFPKADSNFIKCSIAFPNGTPVQVTDQATRDVVTALEKANHDLTHGEGDLLDIVYRLVGSTGPDGDSLEDGMGSGSHVGTVEAELIDTSKRDDTAQELIAAWRNNVAEMQIAGIETIKFNERAFGPAGTPIEFKFLSSGDDPEQIEQLEEAVERCKKRLSDYAGVFDVQDDSAEGKWEYRIRVKEDAQSLGVTTGDLADTIRAAYFGAEVMRLQRGRHEVKLMVRYPKKERSSIADFNEIFIRTNDGVERPISELAEIDVVRGYSEINRVDQKRSITISADVDEDVGNARRIVKAMQSDFLPELLAEFPYVQVRWEGQQEQTQESVRSLLKATGVALLAMFVLLTMQFKSYIQPFLVMAIIPFGLVGAVLGHIVMGLPLTLMSFFGLVALTGVLVNDSIVLIDFINCRVRSGESIDVALVESGKRRFRPVLLTSVTTIAGLSPIMLESSFQAQILVPMAVSLSFGLMTATLLVVILVPSFYRIHLDLISLVSNSDQARQMSISAPAKELSA